MVAALCASFEHYAADPKTNNTVPGQFGEYFDGKSLINRGMRLSPWEPPRFLWAAVEGVCGLILTTGIPRIKPLIPATWKWIALKRVPYHGRELTYFAVRQDGSLRIYASTEIEADFESERFNEDVSAKVRTFSESAVVVALERSDAIVVLVGNVGLKAALVPVNIAAFIDMKTSYDVRVYNSEREAWERGTLRGGKDFGTVALPIEPEGYRLIQLQRRQPG